MAFYIHLIVGRENQYYTTTEIFFFFFFWWLNTLNLHLVSSPHPPSTFCYQELMIRQKNCMWFPFQEVLLRSWQDIYNQCRKRSLPCYYCSMEEGSLLTLARNNLLACRNASQKGGTTCITTEKACTASTGSSLVIHVPRNL